MRVFSVAFSVFIISYSAAKVVTRNAAADEGLVTLNSKILEIEQFLSDNSVRRDDAHLAEIWKRLGTNFYSELLPIIVSLPLFQMLSFLRSFGITDLFMIQNVNI